MLAEIDRHADVRLRNVPAEVLDVRIFTSQPARVSKLLREHSGAASQIESIDLADGRLRVRFSNHAIAIAGDAIEKDASEAFTRPMLDVTNAVVAFCDPNATKALHIGHMRNLVVGEAIASLHELAGSQVVRQSIVCDTGQTAAEAVAGYVALHAGDTPESTGVRPDVFVGKCYAEFAFEHGDTHPTEPDPDSSEPAGSLDTGRPDRAILRRLRADDPEVCRIWEKLRAWVLDGHRKTFARLGIEFDRILYESEALTSIAPLVAQARGMGVFTAREDGALELVEADANGRRLTMVRADGHETGYMRRFVIWCALNGNATGPVRCINLNGSEWTQGTRLRDAGVKRMMDCPLYDDYRLLPVGMVHIAGRKVTSRRNDALLIDACLDWLSAHLTASPDASLLGSTEKAARLLLVCSLLNTPVSRPIEFDLERVLNPRINPGWSIGRALHITQTPTTHEPDAEQNLREAQAYRFAVLKAYELSQVWESALDLCEPREVVRYLHSLSAWYLTARRSERLDRVVRAALLTGLSSIGLRL